MLATVRLVTAPVLLCTDGSVLAKAALAAGLALVGPDPDVILVTVAEDPDPTLLTGSGLAGGVMSPEAFDDHVAAVAADAQQVLDDAAAALGLDGAERVVLRGAAGEAICRLADERSARAVVVGSRGRGGLKRAALGSVSDHVVRNAPCPVIVTR